MPNIKLQSSDGEVFEVDVEIAKVSKRIKTMLEGRGIDEVNPEIVPLPNINSAILKKVIEWATYHHVVNHRHPSSYDDSEDTCTTDNVSSWVVNFLKVDQSTLFLLVEAANNLGIELLQDVLCKTLANMIKDKTPEEIRMIFKIKMPPDLEEPVHSENE